MHGFRRFAAAAFRAGVVAFLAWQALSVIWLVTATVVLSRLPLGGIDAHTIAIASAGTFAAALGLLDFWRAYRRE